MHSAIDAYCYLIVLLFVVVDVQMSQIPTLQLVLPEHFGKTGRFSIAPCLTTFKIATLIRNENESTHEKKRSYNFTTCCSSNTHAQSPILGYRNAGFFCLKLKQPQGLYYMSANVETKLKRRLAWAFAGRPCDRIPFSHVLAQIMLRWTLRYKYDIDINHPILVWYWILKRNNDIVVNNQSYNWKQNEKCFSFRKFNVFQDLWHGWDLHSLAEVYPSKAYKKRH